jgi:DNA-binding MarR family transcriptional regulator
MRSISQPTATPAEEIDRAALSKAIIAQFRSGLRELRCMSGDKMRRTELSFTNSHILSMLDHHGEMPMSRVAEMLDVSLSNASGVIDRLEDRGLVERLRVPDDRRVVLVRATDAGRTALTRAEVLKEGLLQNLLDRLDGARLQRLALALEDVRAAAVEAFASDPDLVRHEHISGSPLNHIPGPPDRAGAPSVPASHA